MSFFINKKNPKPFSSQEEDCLRRLGSEVKKQLLMLFTAGDEKEKEKGGQRPLTAVAPIAVCGRADGGSGIRQRGGDRIGEVDGTLLCVCVGGGVPKTHKSHILIELGLMTSKIGFWVVSLNAGRRRKARWV